MPGDEEETLGRKKMWETIVIGRKRTHLHFLKKRP
jgi:hypothetical protein